jgi:tetratricopeptide (TPR) repeat protein
MKKLQNTSVRKNLRRAWVPAALIWCTGASAGAIAQSSQASRGPRFFVPDFRSSDGSDETSWVALAVSEGLRNRLGHGGFTRAVSDMRTAAVMGRISGASGAAHDQVVRVAQLLGADLLVTGAVGRSGAGYAAQIRLSPIRPEGPDRSRNVQEPSVRALLDSVTKAVLELSGIDVSEAQRRKIYTLPGGTDSAVEYHAKAIRALRAGRPTDSLHYVAESVRYDSTFRPTMKLLGQMNLAAGNEQEVLAIYERLLRQAKLDDDPVDEVFAMIQIGMVHQRRGNLSVAEKYYGVAMKKSEEMSLIDLQALALGAMANLRVDQRKRAESLALLGQRLQLLEAEGDRLAMGPAYMTLALVHAAKGEMKPALDCLDQSAKLADEAGMPSDRAAALFQKGELYKEKGMLDEALESYQASLKLTSELETGSAYRQIAEIYEQQGKFAEALRMLRKAETTLSKRKAYAQQANCLSRIARLQMKDRKPAEAIQTMTEAVDILRDLRHPDLPAYEKDLTAMKEQAKKP